MFLDQRYCSYYPVQPFIFANYVRAHRPSAPLLIDALLYPPDIANCQLGIRLSYHRITHASPFSVQQRPKVLNVARFRTAIWDRNVIVSSIALFTWLAGLAFNIRSAFRASTLQTTPYPFPVLCMQL